MKIAEQLLKKLKLAGSSKEFENSTISVFKNDQSEFKEFLYFIFYTRLKTSLIEKYSFRDLVLHKSDKIDHYFKDDDFESLMIDLQNRIDLFVPKPKYPVWKFLFILFLATIPFFFVIYLILDEPVLTVILLEVNVLGVIFFASFTLLGLLSYLRPSFFSIKKIPNVKTINDLVLELIKINHVFFEVNNYRKSRTELKRIYQNPQICENEL